MRRRLTRALTSTFTSLLVGLLTTPAAAAPPGDLAAAVARGRDAPDRHAVAALKAEARRHPALAEALTLQAAEAALRGDLKAQARALAAPLVEHPQWGSKAQWIWLSAGGRPCKEAVPMVDQLRPDPPWVMPAPRLALAAEIHRACKDPEGAHERAVQLATGYPTTEEGQIALRGLSLSPEDHLRLAEGWIKGRAYAEADAVYAALADTPLAQAALMARAQLRLAPWRQGFTEARQWFEAIAQAPLGEGLSPTERDAEAARREEALYLAARAAGRAGDADTDAAYKAYLLRYPEGRYVGAARFFRAFLRYERGDYLSAAAAFGEIEGGSWADAARWYRAWSLYLAGHKAGDAALAAVAAKPGQYQEQGRYWAAKAALRTDPAAGRAQLRAIAEAAPLSWYGLMIRRAHPELAPPLQLSGEIPPDPLADDLAPLAARLKALTEAGLPEYARRLLAREASALRKAQRWTDLYALSALIDDGRRLRQLTLVRHRGTLVEAPDVEGLPRLRRALPRPWASLVRQIAAREQISPHLIWSFMWLESGFNPDALSEAHARGLMQLLDRTARRIVEARGQEAAATPDLFDPGVNVDLGGWYVGALLARFGGQLPLAAAAYNAGPSAVVSWLEQLRPILTRRGTMPLDVFVDRIPYKQTRAYVKKLSRLYFLYEALEVGVPKALTGLPSTVRPEIHPGVDF